MFMNGNLYEERGEDRRIRKSKKALQEALIRLLSKKSIGEITIKELTDEADVHRGTFYHHYADAMDLKVQTEREIAEQLTEILSSVPQSRLEQGPYPLLVRVLEYLENGKLLDKPSKEEVKAMMLRHARMQVECKGDYTGIREMRKHISWYTTGLPGSAKLRGRINSVESLAEMEELLQEM